MGFIPLQEQLEKAKKIEQEIASHEIFIAHPSINIFIALGLSGIDTTTTEPLIKEYNLVAAYRKELIEKIVARIEADNRIHGTNDQEYTENVRTLLNEESDISEKINKKAIDILVKAIKLQSTPQWIEEAKRNEAIENLQFYIEGQMNRMYAGHYKDGQEVTYMEENFDNNILDILGVYSKEYNIDLLRKKMADVFKANNPKDKKTITDSGIDEKIQELDFWKNFSSKFKPNKLKKNNILKSLKNLKNLKKNNILTEANKIARLISEGFEDPIEYAVRRIKGDPITYNRGVKIEEEEYVLLGINRISNENIKFPESVLCYNLDDLYERLKPFVNALWLGKSSEKYLNAANYKAFSAAVEGKSPAVVELLWEEWSLTNYEKLIAAININGFDQLDKYDLTLITLRDEILGLNLHASIDNEKVNRCAVLWIKAKKLEKCTIKGKALNLATFLLTERYDEFCKSNNITGKVTAIAKITPVIATVKTIIDGIRNSKNKLDTALNAENNNGQEALSAVQDKFEAILSIEKVFTTLGTVTGLNIGTAILAIPGYVSEARAALKLRSGAKTELVAVKKELVIVQNKIGRAASIDLMKKKNELDARIFALGIVMLKKLRQFIWDIVEILKRALKICAKILELTGVAAIAGFGLDSIKALINLLQQSYYLGRAIYKKAYGKKGVDRRAAANIIIKDAFESEEEYALEIIIKTSSNKKSTNEDLAKAGKSTILLEEIKKLKSDEVANQKQLKLARDEMRGALFKGLSSKPSANVLRLMFPATGGY